ncbi:xylose ABC transporter ATP-binding protein [Lentibacillus salicampi]|uniref:Xylose ABC transporter ATP-binding protein n=1 Tax=Lentibacillus salicampi TaxID=175306 RepID=A0A4Y9ACP6_9BACI|nr:xylose ABC transporter ATP-binding protein [Lentibacillus salicampi]TFJ93082.1 xylose ABC transporter ATP-binding protein [Lentibacillus salicampi]
MSGYALQMKRITKAFPGVKALDDVTLSVKKGEIHALCGENGAGKSTLMKILSGVYPAGSFDGEILIDGKEVSFRDIRGSQDAGVAIIYQELALVPEMTVGENIFLSSDLMREKVLNWNKLYVEAKRWLDQIGLDIDPQRKLGELTVGKQQLIEIVKALTKNAEILILDEPTAALTESEVKILMGILKDLQSKGVTCIYISHKLGEVMALADSVTVLRDGRTIDTLNASEITEDTIVSKMVGRSLTDYFPYEAHEIGEETLNVHNYSFYHTSADEKVAHNVSFTLRKGEILGVSGLMGAGRSELFISLFGGYPGKKSGEVTIDGKPANIKKPSDAIRAGLAYVSEDRKRYGLILGMEITKNATLAALQHVMPKGLIDSSLELKSAEAITSKLNLKAHSLEAKVDQLSGGNQQKVVLSKWLFTDPKILILDEPTRGIDVGAKTEIYKIINELSQQGVGIIMISSELPEVLGMSDRILVMADGTISGELSREEATEESVMKLATRRRDNHEPAFK